ncbi:hypothetical protein JTB14_037199 [Gonioctena quinquepunctata]|nr:hypothetical protein JTB14_037199 [Gonioctena quinquepunctata]
MKENSALISLALIVCSVVSMTHAAYKIGVGRADCTGPSAEITFMGYAKAGQKGCGIHLRQYSRAYIFDDGKNRVAFVTIDACMMNHGVRQSIHTKEFRYRHHRHGTQKEYVCRQPIVLHNSTKKHDIEHFFRNG